MDATYLTYGSSPCHMRIAVKVDDFEDSCMLLFATRKDSGIQETSSLPNYSDDRCRFKRTLGGPK